MPARSKHLLRGQSNLKLTGVAALIYLQVLPPRPLGPCSMCNALSRSFFRSRLARLYVGSLHFNLTEQDIKQVFEPFGELDFVDLHRDPGTGRSKGYAFVQ